MIFPSTPLSLEWSLSLRVSDKNLERISYFLHKCCMPNPSHCFSVKFVVMKSSSIICYFFSTRKFIFHNRCYSSLHHKTCYDGSIPFIPHSISCSQQLLLLIMLTVFNQLALQRLFTFLIANHNSVSVETVLNMTNIKFESRLFSNQPVSVF